MTCWAAEFKDGLAGPDFKLYHYHRRGWRDNQNYLAEDGFAILVAAPIGKASIRNK